MKKIISLLMACMLLFSVSAFADSYSTIEMGTPELVNGANGDYYKITIDLTKLPAWNYGDDAFQGYNGFQVEVAYDDTKFDPGYVSFVHPVLGNTYTYGSALIPLVDRTTWQPVDDYKAAAEYKDGIIKFAVNVGTSSVFCSEMLYSGTPYYTSPKTKYAEIYLTPKAGATGEGNVSFSFVELAGPGDVMHNTNNGGVTAIGATIDLGGEEEPEEPVVPEKSTVKTFPKLKWDAATGSLTTVGVVTIGKDIEGMKYGINIVKGEGTVNYWTDKTVLTTSGAEAYYAIQLDGITETTDITVNSASKAVLSNGATGEAVTYVAE